MATAQIDQLLKAHELRITLPRQRTLAMFMRSGYALSQPDIERDLKAEGIDRVTLYRALSQFLDKGLIHKVLDDEGATKYALCHHQGCAKSMHQDEHVHFKCSSCGNTNCLDDSVSFPHFQAPAGYEFSMASVLIQGKCPNCTASTAAVKSSLTK